MATFFPELTAFKGEADITKIGNKSLIIELQLVLKRAGFLSNSPVDGIPGLQTLRAFAEFKEKSYLAHPTKLGASTVKELLEVVAIGTHPTHTDKVQPGQLIGVTMTLPTYGLVEVAQHIPGSKYFTWAHATANGTRLPTDVTVVKNIIKMALYLDKVSDLFGRGAFQVTSWYRPLLVNRAVGSGDNSRHIVGDGVDGTIRGIPPHDLFKKLNVWHGKSGGLGDGDSFTHIDGRGWAARWKYN